MPHAIGIQPPQRAKRLFMLRKQRIGRIKQTQITGNAGFLDIGIRATLIDLRRLQCVGPDTIGAQRPAPECPLHGLQIGHIQNEPL